MINISADVCRVITFDERDRELIKAAFVIALDLIREEQLRLRSGNHRPDTDGRLRALDWARVMLTNLKEGL